MDTSLVITVSEQLTEKKRKRSVTNINPQATNLEMKNFAVALINLTTAQYVEGERVDKTNIDNGGSFIKQSRNPQISNLAPNSTATIIFNIEENENKSPVIFYWTSNSVTYLATTPQTSEVATEAIQTFTTPNSTGVVYIGFTATDSFLPDFIRMECQ